MVRARDGDPLFLAAGELDGVLVPLLRHADLLQKAHPQLLGLATGHPLHRRRSLDDVLDHAKVLLARVYLLRLAKNYAVRRFRRRSRRLAR
jgi:hypothetical protein